MKYKTGQKVRIKKDGLDTYMNIIASSFNPPYIATIHEIEYESAYPDSGKDMYVFEECLYGWYEHEIECLYEEEQKKKIKTNIFDFIDLG